MSGVECNYFEVPCTRSVQGNGFSQGIQDYVFSIGAPNCWTPSKSFYRVDMSLFQAGTGGPGQPVGLPLTPSQLSAMADNCVGNLFDNVYARAGQQDISSIVQYASQGSALKVRINNTLPWLKSLGSSTAVNESSFIKRLNQVSANPATGAGAASPNSGPQTSRLGGNKEIYRAVNPYTTLVPPFVAPNPAYTTATVRLTTIDYQTAAGPVDLAPALALGYVVNGVGTNFTTGMPSVSATGYPLNFGGSVIQGDILVIEGVEYEVSSVTSDTVLEITAPAQTVIAGNVFPATTDWFIMRGDVIRDKQASSTTYALWQPSIGLFDYSEELGAGDYRIQLNPNSNFIFNAVECKNPNALTAAALPYNLIINDVRFYCYVEKKMIPDQVRDLYLTEMMIQSKPYSQNLQFSVPPSTQALTIFVQDNTSGSNPQVPPSMFKCLDNTDLTLQNIQITYANVSKPSTNWSSSYSVAHTSADGVFNLAGVDRLEQRYHDSYEESGLDIKSCGCETYYDWLQRGPFFHYSFERDVNNKSTEVQITSVYTSPNVNSNNMRMFIVAHFRKTIQITTANGLVVNVSSREV